MRPSFFLVRVCQHAVGVCYDCIMITYRTLPGDDQATAVYLGKNRVGTIVRLSADRWQYSPNSRGEYKGDVLPSLEAVKEDLEAE